MGSMEHVGQACSECVEWCQRLLVSVRVRLSSERGVNLIEYALLVSLIALVCVASVRYFQGNVTTKLSSSASAIGP